MPTTKEEEEYMMASQGFIMLGADIKSIWGKHITITPRGEGFVRSSPNRTSQLYRLLSNMEAGIWYNTESVQYLPDMQNAEQTINTATSGKFVEIATKEEIQRSGK